MKRKALKTLLAVTLCTAMLGTTAFAADGPGVLDNNTDDTTNKIEGDAGVINPIYKIVVPTKLDFSIDPFEQKGQSGIYSVDFGMINKSNVPVRLDCAVTVSAKEGVTLKSSAAAVTETDDSKLVYIAAEVAGDVTETTANAGAYTTPLVNDSTDNYDAALQTGSDLSGATAVEDMTDTTAVAGDYEKNVQIALGSAATTLTFVLDKADYTTYYTALDKSTSASQFKAVAASEAGSAAFRFSGTVNTKAKWVAEDISATVVYSFLGLRDTNYAAMKAKVVENSHAYVVEKQDVLVSDGTNDLVVYYTGAKPSSVSLVPVEITGTNKNPLALSGDDNIVITNDSITIKASVVAALAGNTASRGKGTYKITVNDVDYTFTFK